VNLAGYAAENVNRNMSGICMHELIYDRRDRDGHAQESLNSKPFIIFLILTEHV
jgi:hypothetical protein